eukprot:maker-scaffold_50-snap-gene-0.2-mRNA-1 protein AED:0.00 eAED:0.00 QI:12/1/1/1/1/1/2/407/455
MSFIEFLQDQSKSFLESLLKDSWSCLSIFRALSEMSRSMIMRLLSFDDEFPLSEISSWFNNSPTTGIQTKSCFKCLINLTILHPTSTKNEKSILYKLNPSFKQNIFLQILSTAEIIPFTDNEQEKKQKSPLLNPSELNQFGVNNWDGVLHFMVGQKRPDIERPSMNLIQLLLELGLMKVPNPQMMLNSTNNFPTITNSGYKFLLQETEEQIWFILKKYVLISDEEKGVEIMQMLFRLQTVLPGNPGRISFLTQFQKELLDFFRQLGILYSDPQTQCFYPTILGTNLFKNTMIPRDLIERKTKLGIIVETNFKCYAYTESKLHERMLRVFLDVDYILPNLVVCSVTRKSVKRGLRHGLDSKGMIEFLRTNAHAASRQRAKVVPDNVADQLFLWEQERDRIKCSPGMLYQNFEGDEFDEACRFALERNILKWSNKMKQFLFVEEKHVAEMTKYFEGN